jgi:DNA-binding response OmpR family regulator
LNRNKILIIEDDEDLQRGLIVRLKASNYDTAFASDAAMALTVARKEAPDLILLDLGLPGGDGFLILDRMKNIVELAGTPVIVVSARDPHANKERALKAGASAFFQKPVDNQELIAAIQHALMK